MTTLAPSQIGSGFLPPLVRAYGALTALNMMLDIGHEFDYDTLHANLMAAHESLSYFASTNLLQLDLRVQMSAWNQKLALSTTQEATRELMAELWPILAKLDYEFLGLEHSNAGNTP